MKVFSANDIKQHMNEPQQMKMSSQLEFENATFSQIQLHLSSLSLAIYSYMMNEYSVCCDDACQKNHEYIHSISHLNNHDEFISILKKIRQNYIDEFQHTAPQLLLNQVKCYVAKNLHTKISLDDLSSYLHISKFHFCREFKKQCGMTFVDYVLQERLNEAKHYLINSNESIDNIASTCGFTSSSYFCRIFKIHYKVTPSQYRKSYSTNDSR